MEKCPRDHLSYIWHQSRIPIESMDCSMLLCELFDVALVVLIDAK
jgi:hypothetical protein